MKRLETHISLKSKEPLQQKKGLSIKTKLKKKPKTHTIAWYKKEARTWFNRAVKYRDSHLAAGEWLFTCITCPREVIFKDGEGRFYKNANAGHFQPETYSNTRYNDENVNGQCSYCNHHGFGEQVKYARALELKYGDGTAFSLEKAAKEEKQWSIPELEQIISDSKAQCKFYEEMENG